MGAETDALVIGPGVIGLTTAIVVAVAEVEPRLSGAPVPRPGWRPREW